jgi:hypothetical protein
MLASVFLESRKFGGVRLENAQLFSFPISAEANRSSMVSYEGPAKIFDLRAACVRPTIQTQNFTRNSKALGRGTIQHY